MERIVTTDESLWAAIYALYCLLMDQVNEESSYQALFEQHPAIFSALGMDAAASFEKASSNTIPFDPERNFQPKPDFIGAERSSGNIFVVELKTPFVGDITTSRQDGNRAKFKALAESYISQTTEYVESIRQRPEAREAVKSVLALSKIADYRAVIVYGRRADNDATLVSTLSAQRKVPTEIVFYDDLLDRMGDFYSIARRDSVPRTGWCFVSHLYLAPEQIHAKAFLAEYGAADADRISVYLENDEIVFECCNSTQSMHRLTASVNGLGPHYVRFEFSNDQDGSYMSLNVNNIEADLRLAKSVLKLFPDTELFTLGADSNGRRGAHFYMLEHYFVGRTMDMAGKLGSFHYFQRKVSTSSYCDEFKPQSYMTRDPSGLVQEQEEFKPVLRAWPLSSGA
jgi:hypothetical protein